MEHVPTWLLMINAARVGEPVRPRLLWLQRYIVREVYRSFAALAGLPEDASRQIEDLADLQRFNSAIAELADRQGHARAPPHQAQIGQRLRTARTAAQLTLRQLAARLGWPYTTLANYEEGRRPLRIAQLVAIAAALGRSPAAFLVDLPEAAAVIERIDGDMTAAFKSPSSSTRSTARPMPPTTH